MIGKAPHMGFFKAITPAITLSKSSYTYDGEAKKPAVTVKDGSTTLAAENYTVTYSSNTDAGTATATVTMKGNYSGSSSTTFTINAASLAKAKVTLKTTKYTYDGKAKKPGVKSVVLNGTTLKSGTDYTIGYSNNKAAGKATVTITGKGNYKGKATAKFTINKKTAKIEVKLSGTTFNYNGKVKTPKVKSVTADGKTVKTSEYTVKYADGRVDVGTYDVTITLKMDNLKGSKTVTIKIRPQKTNITSLTARKNGGFKVKWKKQATQTDGYQIQYSLDKNFKSGVKTEKVNKTGTTTKNITKNMQSGKTYYVRIRTFKKVNGKTIFSAWSPVKSVKTK